VVNRSYAYNALGIPTHRTIQRQGSTRNDVFTHNDRSELTAATMGDKAFAYDYDNIGNRKTAQEEANDFTYTANALNQYTQIAENDTPFVPAFDADGNQTRIKTTMGIWEAVYNALNRPLTFTRENADGTLTVISADYDYMGRRVFKKVETVATDSETGEETHTVVSNHRFLYRGYLQIAALDLTRTTLNELWFITWDPTEPVATRPLAIQKDGTWYTYGLDLPKNITEVYGTDGYIKTAYTYSPYGLVTSTGSVTQPIQWSSEYHDTDLALVYYNYRHYNPLDGRWTGRDPMDIWGMDNNLYSMTKNSHTFPDILGLASNGLLYRTPDCFYRGKCKNKHKWECQCTCGYRHSKYGTLPFSVEQDFESPPPYHDAPICFCDPNINPSCSRNAQYDNEGLATDVAVVVGLAILTAALLVCPFDGPAGEIVAGAALTARASRLIYAL
jgi:RHS repeat-associated protein